MATEKEELKARDKKEPKPGIRDLKPKKDVKGGAQKNARGDKRPPSTGTGEIDFMNWD
jgi:hypothetical protein